MREHSVEMEAREVLDGVMLIELLHFVVDLIRAGCKLIIKVTNYICCIEL